MVCQAQGRRRRLEESTMHQFPYPLTLDRASYLNHCILHLKDSASKGTLPPVIDTIRVRPMIHQQLDELSMSMICGKHELANHTHTRYQRMSYQPPAQVSTHQSIPLFVGHVRRQPSRKCLLKDVHVPLARGVVHAAGQLKGLGGDVRGCHFRLVLLSVPLSSGSATIRYNRFFVASYPSALVGGKAAWA